MNFLRKMGIEILNVSCLYLDGNTRRFGARNSGPLVCGRPKTGGTVYRELTIGRIVDAI